MKIQGKELDLFEKVLIVALVLIVVNSTYLHFKNWKLQNQLFKVVENSKKENQDSLNVTKKNIETITRKRKKRTKIVQKKAKQIDEKLKQDEKAINDGDVTDDELDRFITDYEKRAKKTGQ